MRLAICTLLLMLSLSVTAQADPVLINFTGNVIPAAIVQEPLKGVDAQVGDAISGFFNLSGSTFQVTINNTHFVVENPTVTSISGDPVIGVTFSVWGDIVGTDDRMQLRFFSDIGNFGCSTCTVDLPASSFLDYKWKSALLFLRSNLSPNYGDSGPALPAGEFYPVPYPYAPNHPAEFYLDGLINTNVSPVPPVPPVPEPSTFVLMGSGVAVLLCVSWRRRAHRR